MSALTVVYALLMYIATAILLIGVGRKIYIYARTPQPLKIPTTPAPTTRFGVVLRVAREVTVFESLFKSNKWIWLFGFLFHLALLLAFFRHLRYALSPDSLLWPIINLEIVQTAGKYGAFAMVAGLGGLFLRRIVVDRVRYISSPSDYLMLILLFLIAASGMMMTFVQHTDIVALKAFLLGWMLFDWQPLPADPTLLVHLGLVMVLAVVFPVSKLLHAPGVFFSPTRNQVDNPREKRWTAGWSAELKNIKAGSTE